MKMVKDVKEIIKIAERLKKEKSNNFYIIKGMVIQKSIDK